MGARAELVLIPCPIVGHLVSMVEVAKLLVDRDEGLSVAVLVIKLSDSSALKTIVDSVSTSSSSERIRFIKLPQPVPLKDSDSSSRAVNILNSVEGCKPHVRDVVLGFAENHSSPDSPRIAGLVVDMFCCSMIDVANEFGLPTYLFFTSSATFLGAIFHLQALRDDRQQDVSALIEQDATIDYHGFVNPLPAKFLPSNLLEKDAASMFLDTVRRFRETKGIVVNSFEDLESGAIESVFNDKLPPLYPVGPILSLGSGADDAGSGDILKWLDSQQPGSVVFLCFGSMGSFHEDQVRQIAHALERSSHWFLWSLRRRPHPLPGKIDLPSNYENPEEILPEGFLDRTAGKGKVIGWAPQAQVLAHPAIGGFVSHCGWNSILESIWFGVPVAAWPMYAEQPFNAFALVEELRMAVEIQMDYKTDYLSGKEDIVPAEDIERGIRCLMEMESEQKEKVKLMSEKCRRAFMEGGSSHLNLGRFIKVVHDNVP